MNLIDAQICSDLQRGVPAVTGQHNHRDPGRFELRNRPLRRRLQSVGHTRKRNHLPRARRENH